MTDQQSFFYKNSEIKKLLLGGTSGCISKSMVAPLDKIKVLMQFRQTNLSFTTFMQNNIKEEGILNLWKGNGVNLLRVFPFSGLQFVVYDLCKEKFTNKDEITNIQRLTFGATAAIVATTFTHPIDVIKHRLLCYSNIHNFKHAFLDIYKENGSLLRNFYKGYGSTISSLTPFIALNFCTFDFLKDQISNDFNKNNPIVSLSLGATSGAISQTLCYPLDTIRRRMQNKDKIYINGFDACKKIIKYEGYKSFYKGLLPNTLRIIPNIALRFALFDYLNEYFK